MKKFLSFIAIVLVIIVSCTKGNVDNSSNNNNNNPICTGTKSYATDVSPVISSICASSGCHDAASVNGPGPLTTYQQVFNARATIRSAVASGLMPQNSTLPADQKNAILCWIDNGALNN